MSWTYDGISEPKNEKDQGPKSNGKEKPKAPPWLDYVIGAGVGLVLLCLIGAALVYLLPKMGIIADPFQTPTVTAIPTSTLEPTSTLALVPTATLAPTATPETLLFFDDFSNPPSIWISGSLPEVQYEILDGAYQITVLAPDYYAFSTAGLPNENASILVDITRSGGPAQAEVGLVCRYQDEKNLYMFAITAEGTYAVYKRVKGLEYPLGMETPGTSAAILRGEATNRLRVDCIGSNLRFFSNDILLVEAQDSDLPVGDVGMVVGTFQSPGASARFDNFAVHNGAP